MAEETQPYNPSPHPHSCPGFGWILSLFVWLKFYEGNNLWIRIMPLADESWIDWADCCVLLHRLPLFLFCFVFFTKDAIMSFFLCQKFDQRCYINFVGKGDKNFFLEWQRFLIHCEEVCVTRLLKHVEGLTAQFSLMFVFRRKKMRPPPVPQQEGDGSAPVTPTTPTTPITPTTHGGQPVIQPGDRALFGRYLYYLLHSHLVFHMFQRSNRNNCVTVRVEKYIWAVNGRVRV